MHRTVPSREANVHGFRVDHSAQLPEFEYDFAYGIDEETVKTVIGNMLRQDGYSVRIAKSKEKGPDVEAGSYERTLIIEAKGEGTSPPMYNNFFVVALGQILQRMTRPNATYVIALPFHKKYVRLFQQLPQEVRLKLNLEFWFVGVDGINLWQVAILKPQAE